MASPIVQMEGITKVYRDGTVALKSVDLRIEEGEIHGLLGENGAGKTTLMKILSGLLPPTSGRILVRGEEKRLKTPLEGLKVGIGMVHQHFALVPPYTALQNIMLGQEGGGPLSLLKTEELERRLTELMVEVGLNVPLNVPIELLSIGARQKVEILKLLYRKVDLLILDEPTSVLTPIEVGELVRALKELKKMGKSAIFITHKLKEVLEVTSRITVLRRGSLAGKLQTKEATPEKLAVLMVGMESIPKITKSKKVPGKPVLVVKDIKAGNDLGALAVEGVSFEVRSGEIFGIAGVEGNGQTELVQAITGLRPVQGGTILINGEDTSKKGSRDLYKMGLAHIPEDKRRFGLILDFNLTENSLLGMHKDPRFVNMFRGFRWSKIHKNTEEILKKFSIAAPGIMAPARSLSGGNQQKLVVGRELDKSPSLVVAAQPTRGLDIAATHFIRDLLVKLRDEDKAVLLVSADLDEIMSVCDRIAVMYEGEFAGILTSEELDREKIGMMMGGM